MFLREGSQSRAASITCLCAVFAAIVFTAAPVAGANAQAQSTGVQLPREILPWRRQIEARAERLLASARQSIRAGNTGTAERQLRQLLEDYPRTHAAADGKRDLALLREPLPSGVGPRGLGVPPEKGTGAVRQEMDPAPVAGWQTVVVPEPTNMREALIEAAGDRVFFDEGSTRLSRHALAVLKKQARWLSAQANVKVRVVGHADDSGTDERNMRLSHDRAVAVRRLLIRYGVSPKRLDIFSHGKGKPIAICTVRTCTAQNRRVVTEIRVPDKTAASN